MTLNYDKIIEVMRLAIISHDITHCKEAAQAALEALQGELPDIVINSKLPDEIYLNEGAEAIITYDELKNLREEE